ncbi:unnamed protein product, partial [Rotaria magnacalcarata]
DTDENDIISCLKSIIINIENDGGNDPSSTKSCSNKTNISFDIGVDLRQIYRMNQTCLELVNQTTEIDCVEEKVLNDTLN